MRHRVHHRKLNRTMEHRKALRRNMAQSLFEHGRIATTVPKAKDLRPFAEKLITLAVRVRRCRDGGDTAGALTARRTIHKLLSDRSMVPSAHKAAYDAMSDAARAKTMRFSSARRHRTGEPKGRLAFTAESIIHRLIESIAPRYVDRPGGYTRVIRLAGYRIGDSSRLAMLQLVGEEEAPGTLTRPGKSARRRRADSRYALAVSTAKARSQKAKTAAVEAAPAEPSDEPSPPTTEDNAQATSEDSPDKPAD